MIAFTGSECTRIMDFKIDIRPFSEYFIQQLFLFKHLKKNNIYLINMHFHVTYKITLNHHPSKFSY